MSYTKQSWADDAAGNTPINAARLSHIEDGIAAATATADGAAPAGHTHADLTSAIATKADAAAVTTALAGKSDTSHTHTKANVGLGNVDNTSDVNKPVSTATQTALDAKAALTHSHALADLPAGTTITVQKSGGTWPARPTARTDVFVAWKGADPSPAIVSSGTGGMLDGVDYRLVTP